MNEKGNIIIWVSIMLMVLALSAMLVITTATLGLNMRKDDEKIKQALYLAEGVVDVSFTLLADELLLANEVAINEANDYEEFCKYYKKYFNKNSENIKNKLKNKKNYTELIDKESQLIVGQEKRISWNSSDEDCLSTFKIEVIHKNVKKAIKVDFVLSIPNYNTSNEELINFVKVENYRYDNNEN